ncbi:hypothetical protein SEA_ALLEB_105 [Microbacterium phage Alleb]|nr:hypothetical protein SEA_ALLEB_105 [Microbacterium phage Alleb]
MTLSQAADGKWYGTLPVILTRVVEPDPKNEWDPGVRVTESLIGSKAPYGQVMVREEFEGKRWTEKPVDWWESKGFIVTFDRAMEILREGRRA